jgi:hypothetical protein
MRSLSPAAALGTNFEVDSASGGFGCVIGLPPVVGAGPGSVLAAGVVSENEFFDPHWAPAEAVVAPAGGVGSVKPVLSGMSPPVMLLPIPAVAAPRPAGGLFQPWAVGLLAPENDSPPLRGSVLRVSV